MRQERKIASARPSTRPLITTAAAISIVTATPFMMAGKYRSISSHLKNVSRKRDQSSMTASTHEVGNEGASSRLARRGENRLGAPFFDDHTMVHEDDAV